MKCLLYSTFPAIASLTDLHCPRRPSLLSPYARLTLRKSSPLWSDTAILTSLSNSLIGLSVSSRWITWAMKQLWSSQVAQHISNKLPSEILTSFLKKKNLKAKPQKEREGEIFNLQVYFTNDHNGQGRSKLLPGSWNSMWGSEGRWDRPNYSGHLLLLSQSHYQAPGLDVEH